MHNASLNARLRFFWVNSPVQIRNEMLVLAFELRTYSLLMKFWKNELLLKMKTQDKCLKRLSPFWHACILISYCVNGSKFSRRVDWFWPTEEIRGATLPGLAKTLYSTGILGTKIPLKTERENKHTYVCRFGQQMVNKCLFFTNDICLKNLNVMIYYCLIQPSVNAWNLSWKVLEYLPQSKKCVPPILKYNNSIQRCTLWANKNEGMFHFLKNTRQLEMVPYIFPGLTYS